MPAVRQPTVYHDPSLVCTCPTDSPLPDHTPLIPKTTGKKRVRSRRVKNQDHIPRPRNAFIIFRSHYINFLKSKDSQHDHNHNADDHQPQKTQSSSEYQQNQLSKIAAKVWNGMDPDERKPYSEEAKKEKEWHKRMYPDYVYRAPGPTNANEKTKNFKIKVNMGNPSKARHPPSPPPPLPSTPQRDVWSHPNPSEVTCSNDDIQVVGVPPLWHDPQPYIHIAAEQEFVPTECIPPLDLCSSHPIIEQEEIAVTFKDFCHHLQPAYAVDLSPRASAYDRQQAKDTVIQAVMVPVDPLIDHMSRYQYGITEPLEGGDDFGTEQYPAASSSSSHASSPVEGEEEVFLDVSSFNLNEGIDTSFPDDNVLPYLSSSPSSSSSSTLTSSSSSSTSSSTSSFMAGSDMFYPNAEFDLFSMTSAEADLESFQVGSMLDDDNNKFMFDLDLDLDAPDLNFAMGVGEDEMSRGLAAWAGYE